MNPKPFTLRQLDWMAQGRQESDWAQTLALIESVLNIFRSTGRFNIQQLMPAWLRREIARARAADVSPEEAKANMDTLNALVGGMG